MPGLRSPGRLAARRARAVARHFVVPPASIAFRRVRVPAEVAPRVKRVAESLALHCEHVKLTGKDIPFARAAAREAAPVVGRAACRVSMRVHDAANVAKHAWADVLDEEFVASATATAGGELLGIAECVAGPVPQRATPSWRPAAGTSCLLEDAPPRRSEVRLPGDPAVLRADACVFSPSGVSGPLASEACGYPALAAPASAYEQLICAQNDTIAILAGRLDSLFPSRRRLKAAEDAIKRLESDLRSLAASLPSALDAKLAAVSYVSSEALDSRLDSAMRGLCDSFTVRLKKLFDELKGKTLVPDPPGACCAVPVASASRSSSLGGAGSQGAGHGQGAVAGPPSGPGAPVAADAEAAAPYEFMRGAVVEIFGLVQDPALNGMRGRVVTPGDSSRDRVAVALRGGRRLSMRAANLRCADARRSAGGASPASADCALDDVLCDDALDTLCGADAALSGDAPYGHDPAERSSARTSQNEKRVCRPSESELARRVAAASWA